MRPVSVPGTLEILGPADTILCKDVRSFGLTIFPLGIPSKVPCIERCFPSGCATAGSIQTEAEASEERATDNNECEQRDNRVAGRQQLDGADHDA